MSLRRLKSGTILCAPPLTSDGAATFAVLFALATVFGPALLAGEVKFDGSLGAPGALSGPTFLIPADRGKQMGGNLFHSFSDFHLIKDDVATFQGPANVQNILARVTGGTASNIDGTLRSEIAGANLYLLNSAGVIFGPNAQLDLSGSFTVTTADFVKLADGGRFNALPAVADSLTSAPVSAFGFLTNLPAAVHFNGSNLTVPEGASLAAIAGDITLDGATLAAPGGTLALFSAKSAGELVTPATNPTVNFRAAIFTAGDVVLRSGATASIDSARGGGKVVIRGGRLTVTESSTISSRNQGANAGGTVELTAETMAFLLGGRAVASAQNSGGGGALSIQAADLTVDGEDGAQLSSVRTVAESGTGDSGPLVVEAQTVTLTRGGQILSRVDPGAGGASGDLTVTVTTGAGRLEIGSGALLVSDTFGSGKGGNVSVFAKSLSIDGGANFTGIVTAALDTGDAGNVVVQAGQMEFLEGGEIVSLTFGGGKGGNLSVTADNSLSIDGRGLDVTTGISAQANQGSGDAGDVTVQAGTLQIRGGGEISDNTFSSGQGGKVSVMADSLTIDGNGAPFPTRISGSAVAGTGHAGAVVVEAREVKLLNAGSISSETFSDGDGGNVSVTARSLAIDGGSATEFTGISGVANSGSGGKAGDVTVKADRLSIRNGAISASTSTDRDGGNVSVTAGSLTIDGRGLPDFSGISASANRDDNGDDRSGNAGKVVVQADQLKILGGAEIAGNTFSSGQGGSVSVTANSISIDGAGSGILAQTNTGSSGDAGDVAVQAGALKIFNQGRITSGTLSSGNGGGVSVTATSLSIFSLGTISSGTLGGGDGGRVTVTADSLSIDGLGLAGTTGITASAGSGSSGDAGDVVVRAGALKIVSAGLIASGTFSGGDGGSVSVTASSLSIDGRGLPGFTGITAQANPTSSGNAGDVAVLAGALKILNRGAISSSTFSRGNGGSVSVTASSLSIDGGGAAGFTGITAQTNPGSSGNAGGVAVKAGDLKIANLGSIASSTFGRGNGGSVSVTANSLFIDGRGRNAFTGIAARAEGRSTGNAGDVLVAAGSVALRKNGGITAASATSAPSGSVRLTAKNVRLDSGSSVSSENTARGPAGSVLLRVRGPLVLDGASRITTSAAEGDAGSIEIHASDRLALHRRSSIASSAGRNGGNISITGSEIVHLTDSSITATAGTQLAPGGTGGTGGNITVATRYVILDHAVISANAALGRGGNIALESDFFLQSSSLITATGAQAGTVVIAAPELDLSAGLVELPGSLFDASSQLREQCARRLGLDFSSFLVIGRGGVSLAPDDAQASDPPPRRRPREKPVR